MAAWRRSSVLRWSMWWARKRRSRPSPSAPTTAWKTAAPTLPRRSARVNGGAGVIILTDMFGGTPSNLAISLLEIGKVEVVAGLNLPMLVKLARIRKDYALDKAATAAQDAGRKYINVASQILGD